MRLWETGGANCRRQKTGVPWSQGKKESPYELLKAAKLAMMTFSIKEKDGVSIHNGMGIMTALAYLLKMELPKIRSWF